VRLAIVRGWTIRDDSLISYRLTSPRVGAGCSRVASVHCFPLSRQFCCQLSAKPEFSIDLHMPSPDSARTHASILQGEHTTLSSILDSSSHRHLCLVSNSSFHVVPQTYLLPRPTSLASLRGVCFPTSPPVILSRPGRMLTLPDIGHHGTQAGIKRAKETAGMQSQR
jgi:hypothetical protein